jgi:hypothetical protein
MAFDEELAERVRDVLGARPGMTEKRMFSGIAFLLDGNMVCAVMARGLMLRLGPEAATAAITQQGVAPFEMRGRVMTGWVLVDPLLLTGTDALLDWVSQGLAFAGTLPPGGTAARKARRVQRSQGA